MPRFPLRQLGPGLILAAAGIGAGDVVVASVTGAKHGYSLLWAVVATAALKFTLTEALARWQLATGTTVVQAWMTRLPRGIGIYFCFYLALWTFLVGASLSSACGLAGASLFGGSPKYWGAAHAAAGFLLLALNRYSTFQRLMKLLIGIMAVCVIGSAVALRAPVDAVASGLFVPRIPTPGGAAALLALLGGIGGSLTVICYGYWLREEHWDAASQLRRVRSDVRLAYVFTAVFGVALVVTAADVGVSAIEGNSIALEVAARIGTVLGPVGRMTYLIGFWCTVFAALLGVWQGVANVIVDTWTCLVASKRSVSSDEQRRVFLAALLLIGGPPLILLWFQRPVAIVVTFSIVGAFFMPFLAGTLLYLNNRRDWMGPLVNGRLGNFALGTSVAVFGAVCLRELALAVLR